MKRSQLSQRTASPTKEPKTRTTKELIITVEFTVEVPKDVDGDDITFAIPYEDIVVHGVDGEITEAQVTGYTTQQYEY